MLATLTLQVVKPDVVLATYEALAGDAGALRAITWEALVLDDRGRPRAAVAKATAALGELTGRWRMLMSHAPPSKARPVPPSPQRILSGCLRLNTYVH